MYNTLFLVWTITLAGYSEGQANTDGFRHLIDCINSTLAEFFQQATAYNTLVQAYNSTLSTGGGDVVKLNESAILESVSTRSRFDFNTFSTAVKNLTNTSSELYSAHYNSSCCSEVCIEGTTSYNSSACRMVCNATEVTNSYYRSAFEGGNLPPLEYSAIFQQNVSLNHTAIHIPVYIYEGRPSVLCFVEWTNNLTEIFQQQWQALVDLNHIITFVYIAGEQSSAARTYPASGRENFKDCSRCPFKIVDTFNAKSRPWYIDTVVGEKHIVVLLDMSGSMMGLASDVARLAAIQLLNSLSSDDFFHVLRVDDNVTSLNGCFTCKTSASVENILAMSNIITSASIPYGQADFGLALRVAYSELNESSSCHKIIVLITDQYSSIPVEEFNELNNHTNINVFAFVVGTTNQHRDVQQLVCNNRGIAIYISGYSDIIQGIQKLTGVLTQLHSQDSTGIFVNRYIDALHEGLIITFSQPVTTLLFNSTRKFVGVVGVDILARNFDLMVNSVLIGPLGYFFVITNSGELTAHPLTADGVVVYEPGLVTFDFLYNEFIEPRNESEAIRKMLIDLTEGELTVLSAVPVEARVRYVRHNFTYFYVDIESGMVMILKLPAAGVYLLSSPTPSTNHLLELQSNLSSYPGEILLSDKKPYCSDWNQFQTKENSSAREALLRVIEEAIAVGEMNVSSAECSAMLYEPLLVDLYSVSQIIPLWMDALVVNRTIISIFAQFSSGLTWCLSPSHSLPCISIYNINFVALAESNGFNKLSVYRGLTVSGLEGTVILTRPLELAVNPSPSIGVLGLVMERDAMDDIITEINPATSEEVMYILDDGGFIVGHSYAYNDENTNSSNDEFFGKEYPSLFMDLVNRGVFVERTVVGYNLRKCNVRGNEDVSGSARSMFTGILLSLVSLVWTLATTALELCIQSLSTILTHLHCSPAMDCVANRTSDCPALDLCVSRVRYYTPSQPGGIPVESFCFECNNSSMIAYEIGSVPGTSLVAVRTNASTKLLSSCEGNAVKQGEEDFVLPCLCDKQLYRAPGPGSCPDDSPEYMEGQRLDILHSQCLASSNGVIRVYLAVVFPSVFLVAVGIQCLR